MKIYLPYAGFILGGLGLLTFVASLFFSYMCCFSLGFFIAATIVFIICFLRGCLRN